MSQLVSCVRVFCLSVCVSVTVTLSQSLTTRTR